MKKVIAICFSLGSIYSTAQNNPNTKTSAPLTCNATLVGTTNPTAQGLCNGTATISLVACSNPPYQIQWFNSNPNSSCQTLPPAESAFTGTQYIVSALCGCPTFYTILITNSIGEQTFFQVAISDPAPTGVYEFSNEMSVSLTPNPAMNILNIDLKTLHIFDAVMEINNAFGQIVLSSVINPGKQTIDLQGFTNGIYFVKFHRAGQQIGFTKIVVQK